MPATGSRPRRAAWRKAGLQASLRGAIGRQEQQVHARPQGHQAVNDAGATLAHGLHVHGIRDGDPLEAQPTAQQSVHDLA